MLRKALAVLAAAAFAAQPVVAHCPLCAAATAGGVAATRLLGVDDTVVGTFIGGFAVSTGLWFSNWLSKKRQGAAIPLQRAISVIASVALMILTLYLARLLGSADPSFLMFGVDKLLVGLLVGSAATVAAFAVHKWIRAVRGRSLMPYQGIAVTLAALAFTGAVFYIVT
ncbi:TPA: hypothetical protein HA231_04400 [Candidatus Woesearchaeota archaeon]|nr:hypothetical protein [Candidatus Woesearchaeota archaeon]